jgi:hypothetical protein
LGCFAGLVIGTGFAFLSLDVLSQCGECKMAQPAWKRPGSPIGKRGVRKAHPKYKQRAGQTWSSEEVKQLRTLARRNTPTGVLSVKLRRPPAAKSIDVLFTDVNLGGSASGWDVAECFRAARPDVPVVYTSGNRWRNGEAAGFALPGG